LKHLPIRKGAPPLTERNKPIEYYVQLYADHLPAIDKPGMFEVKNHLNPQAGCDPFVRISMEGAKATSDHLADQRRRVLWPNPIKIKTKMGCTRAKVELLDADVGLIKDTEKPLGEQTIYNLQQQVNKWIHLYGGAIYAERPDIGTQVTF